MSLPTLLPSSAEGETFAGFRYHLDGALVPALTVEINAAQSIYFEHHTLLWKSSSLSIGIKKLAGAFKRVFAGLPIFMTETQGKGAIAFSRDGAGQIFAIHLKQGQEIDVREHQFLAATGSVAYSYQMVKGVANILFGGSGFFVDKFVAADDHGIVWLHGYGNVFEVTLAAGEQIDVEPSAWLYKDPSVQMSTNLTNITTGIFSSSSFTLNRFTGPGRVGIQSMSLPNLSTGSSAPFAPKSVGAAGIAGGVLGGVLGLFD